VTDGLTDVAASFFEEIRTASHLSLGVRADPAMIRERPCLSVFIGFETSRGILGYPETLDQ
jgi:hypothetical protein